LGRRGRDSMVVEVTTTYAIGCLGIVAFLKYNKEAQYIILITVIQLEN
jgi:hypothetical protein